MCLCRHAAVEAKLIQDVVIQIPYTDIHDHRNAVFPVISMVRRRCAQRQRLTVSRRRALETHPRQGSAASSFCVVSFISGQAGVQGVIEGSGRTQRLSGVVVEALEVSSVEVWYRGTNVLGVPRPGLPGRFEEPSFFSPSP